jgi:hypothetical protein
MIAFPVVLAIVALDRWITRARRPLPLSLLRLARSPAISVAVWLRELPAQRRSIPSRPL